MCCLFTGSRDWRGSKCVTFQCCLVGFYSRTCTVCLNWFAICSDFCGRSDFLGVVWSGAGPHLQCSAVTSVAKNCASRAVAGLLCARYHLACHNASTMRQEHEEKLQAAMEAAGIKRWELFSVDNSCCEGAPLELPAPKSA